jgi:glycosyltransferase involved in cell wall biosynthesis
MADPGRAAGDQRADPHCCDPGGVDHHLKPGHSRLAAPLLSIIIPAYNEERRLPTTLEKTRQFIEQQSYLTEVLVVENGSQDRTFQIADDFSRQHSWLRVIREEQRGKGRAVKRGMLEASGQFRFMCDADLSMPIDEVNRFLPPLQTDFDIAIGSREAPGAVRYEEPLYRHLGGRVINLIIRLLALPGLQDTQCGFKCFRAAVAEDLFRSQTMSGWAFDVEVLFIARKRGYRITEIPIPWYFMSESKVNLYQDTPKMVLDILKIRLNDRRGLYRKA